MFNLEEYSPMEFQYLSEGKIKFNSAIAQLFHYEALGYLKVDERTIHKLRKLPSNAKGSDRIYFNGLFIDTDEVQLDSPYQIVAYTVIETVRYVEFEQYHRTREESDGAYNYMKDELINVDPDLFRYVYADGLEKRYQKKHEHTIPAKYTAWRAGLQRVMTEDFHPIGKLEVSGLGRAFLGASGPAVTKELREGVHIDWDAILKG